MNFFIGIFMNIIDIIEILSYKFAKGIKIKILHLFTKSYIFTILVNLLFYCYLNEQVQITLYKQNIVFYKRQI